MMQARPDQTTAGRRFVLIEKTNYSPNQPHANMIQEHYA
jgi:hypothetical protein